MNCRLPAIRCLIPILLSTLTLVPAARTQAAEHRVWYVDNSRPGGDGSLASPLTTLAAAQSASADGDVIFVFEGSEPYGGGIQLKNGQALVGQATPVADILRKAGITSTDLPKLGKKPVLEAGDAPAIALASSNVIEGLAVHASRGTAIRGTGDGGSTSLVDVSVEISGGEGLVLDGRNGSLHWQGGSISGNGGAALHIEGGSGELTIASAPIEIHDAIAVRIKSSAIVVKLESVTASAVQKRVESAVVVEGASGGFAIEGRSGVAGSGGTIEKMHGRAISIVDSANVVLRNLRLADNSANGLSAATCGSDLINGDNSGCNSAIDLRNVRGATIDGVIVDGSAQIGINGLDVSDLMLANTEVAHAGNEQYEHGIQVSNLLGKSTIRHCNVHDAASRGLVIENGKGEGSVVIEESSFTDSSSSTGEQGVLVGAHGEAHLDVRIHGCKILRQRAAGFQATATDHSDVHIEVVDNTFTDDASAVTVVTQRAATLRFLIDRNHTTGNHTAAISVVMASPSTGVASGSIGGNTIGRQGYPGSGAVCGSCSGINVWAIGNGQLDAAISGNTIVGVDGWGIRAGAGEGAPVVNVAITGNRILEPAGEGPDSAIRIQSGTQATDRAVVCATLGGAGSLANEIGGAWQQAITIWNRFPGTTFRVAGYRGDGKDLAAVAAYVRSMNKGGLIKATLTKAPEGNAYSGGEPCPVRP